MLNNLIRQRSHLAPGDSARVRYSLVACENIRFSSLFATGDVSLLRTKCPQLVAKSEEKRMFSQANSLGTNVSTPFFQVPTLELGHRPGARVQG